MVCELLFYALRGPFLAGALEEDTYRRLLSEAGFSDIEIEVTRRYSVSDVAASGASSSLAALSDAERSELEGKVCQRVCARPQSCIKICLNLP